jgi:GNAT superfamily N-acetyltransferase
MSSAIADGSHARMNGASITEGVELMPLDSPPVGAFQAMFAALDENSRAIIGPASPRPLVLPIHDRDGTITGGLWGTTLFDWLHIGLLVVPDHRRGRGIGTALVLAAETEARRRGCRGAHVDTFSFQAVRFYEKLGYTRFGVLKDYPPGHSQIYFCKRFD